MSTRRGLAMLVVFALTVIACGGTPGDRVTGPTGTTTPKSPTGSAATPEAFVQLAVSRVGRAPAVASDADLKAAVEANTAFALDLYGRLRSGDGNLLFSPYSISLALAMTYAGARGDTAAEMRKVLRFTLPDARVHAAMNAIDNAVTHPDAARSLPSGITPPVIGVANSAWAQTGYPWRQAFLDVLAANYGAGLRLVDYMRDFEGARLAINAWVEDQTKHRIKDLIPNGILNGYTRLVLANAIYLKAAWGEPFDTDSTKTGPFYLLGGKTRQVPMMHMVEEFSYGEGDGYQVVDLPYWGGYSMTVILPAAGRFASFEASLTPARLKAILDPTGKADVTLTMPRFKFEAAALLKDVLSALGMPTAFVPPGGNSGADFTGMTAVRELFVRAVLHKAFISVDEHGTEAAAATAVVVEAVSGLSRQATMTLDRPFLVLIRDDATGSILFMGRVLDPSS